MFSFNRVATPRAFVLKLPTFGNPTRKRGKTGVDSLLANGLIALNDVSSKYDGPPRPSMVGPGGPTYKWTRREILQSQAPSE